MLHGCTPEAGAALGGDVALYRLKDRILPPTQIHPARIEEIIQFAAPSVLTGLARARWSREDLELAADHEGSGVTVTGYLIAAMNRGWSRWSCNHSRWTDLRLLIGEAPDSSPSEAVAAVVAPAWQDANAAWDVATLRALAQRRARVRISGWLLYADDLAVELTHGRSTLWEIHPVTKIEVAQPDGSWFEIVDAAPPSPGQR
ncbi:MAG TPA: hypothetical protein VN690_02265 [Terriglobales bacterium]|nr:hypothetical protein [Terriglobales bacterium]